MYFYNRELYLLQLLMVLLLLNPNMIYWAIYVVAFQAYRTSPKGCLYSVLCCCMQFQYYVGLYMW